MDGPFFDGEGCLAVHDVADLFLGNGKIGGDAHGMKGGEGFIDGACPAVGNASNEPALLRRDWSVLYRLPIRCVAWNGGRIGRKSATVV